MGTGAARGEGGAGGVREAAGPHPPRFGPAPLSWGRRESGLQAGQWERGVGALPHQEARPLAEGCRWAGAEEQMGAAGRVLAEEEGREGREPAGENTAVFARL